MLPTCTIGLWVITRNGAELIIVPLNSVSEDIWGRSFDHSFLVLRKGTNFENRGGAMVISHPQY